MKTHYIYIDPGQLSPSTLPVSPEDVVVFQMRDRTDSVTVDFGSNSPFGTASDDKSFILNGGNSQMSHRNKTVTCLTATNFSYTVSPYPPPPKRKDPVPPPGTLQGDIDVDPEAPPKDP